MPLRCFYSDLKIELGNATASDSEYTVKRVKPASLLDELLPQMSPNVRRALSERDESRAVFSVLPKGTYTTLICI